MDENSKTHEENSQKPKQFKPSPAVVERVLISILTGNPEPIVKQYAPNWPYKFAIVRNEERIGAPVILKLRRNTAMVISAEDVAGLLADYVSLFPAKLADYNQTHSTCLQVVKAWIYRAEPLLRELPAVLGFKSDPELVMKRLNFDPEIIETREQLEEHAPVFCEMLARIETNADAFVMRIGSLFDPEADRKQAVWLYGPPDCGKSELAWLITELAGKTHVSFGAKDTHGPHWKEAVIGKRIVIVQEAASSFLRGTEFKSLTGDDEHAINPKGKPHFNAKLPVMLFFMSNNEPQIPKDEALMLRIIDCHIRSVPAAALLPKDQLRGLLRKELPHIAGYCIARYRSLGGGIRIPVDKSNLSKITERYAGEWLTIIDRLCVVDMKTYVARDDFRQALINEGIRDTRTQGLIKEALLAHYPVREIRMGGDGRRLWVYAGLRRRMPGEAVFGELTDEETGEVLTSGGYGRVTIDHDG